MLKNANFNLHSHNKLLHCLLSRLLIIFKNIVILLFIGLLFFFTISQFSKTNNKIIEGNWFESAASRKRRRQAEEARRQAYINDYYRCLNPTSENWYSCGPRYFFREKHLETAAQETTKSFERKQDSSKKPDKGITTTLNNTVKQY